MVFSHCDSNRIPLEQKLNELFKNRENGFYIELGANDGLTQSNTAFFEKYKNWTGILIEPSIKAFNLCKINRPNSICINCACVSNDYQNNYISGDFNTSDLMASIGGLRLNNHDSCIVPAKTLEEILNCQKLTNDIDFLSLDVEGYELNVLKGLNLNKYRPKWMLIEIYTKDYKCLIDYLTNYDYKLHSNFTNYNHETNPGWDGTHNDYLFFDIKSI